MQREGFVPKTKRLKRLSDPFLVFHPSKTPSEHQAKQNNETMVKIVHGKGSEAILKTCINGWLRQLPEVLAFCSAPPKDGGNGAVLVLLKKPKADGE